MTESKIYSVSYQIDLDISENDVYFGYVMIANKQAALAIYDALVKGCYYQGINDKYNFLHSPSITLIEQVFDSENIVQAEMILKEHRLGDETTEPVENMLVPVIKYDHIDYYKSQTKAISNRILSDRYHLKK